MKKIKTKISAGLMFLFLVIILLSVIGIFYVNKLAQSSKGTINDNYASVQYAVEMLKQVDNINLLLTAKSDSAKELYHKSQKVLEQNIQMQANNITEAGEGELVNNLLSRDKAWSEKADSIIDQSSKTDTRYYEKYKELRDAILAVYNINMNAVLRRNNIASQTADSAFVIFGIVVTLSILITFSFIFSFPKRIVDPITELTERIKAISERNYDQKLQINTKDEIGELASAFNIMAVRLKEYEESNLEKLLFEKKRMDSVIQNMQDGLIILDENNKIIRINNTALKLAGLKEENVIDHYAPEIAGRNDLFNEMMKRSFNEIKKDNEETAKPIKISVEGKEQFYKVESIGIFIQPTGSSAETNIGNVIFLKNITEYQERDVAKTNLIATVSHELKTPLSSINLSLKLLSDRRIGELNDEQKKLVSSVFQQSNRLSKVVNELLDFSQVETGNIRLKITHVKPEDIVDLAATALMMLISEKNIKLETHLDDNLPLINADLEKTVWVLVNILNNAIRYSPLGGRISISAEVKDGEVQFFVKDEGPGISEEDLPKVFNKFVQVGKPSKGSGLGLAISKEFVQSQGGRVWVESQINHGCTFYFTMPVS
jgi:two-component system, NtrC family, sensor histidine kinase KinB